MLCEPPGSAVPQLLLLGSNTCSGRTTRFLSPIFVRNNVLTKFASHGYMRPLTITDPAAAAAALQQEIYRSEESRYDHRLHCVFLVAQGLTCPEVSRLFGDSPRAVELWVRRFEEEGLAGLQEGHRTGRPARLTDDQIREVALILTQRPFDAGIPGNAWDGKTLCAWLEKRFGVQLGVRQCQRLFRRLGVMRKSKSPNGETRKSVP